MKNSDSNIIQSLKDNLKGSGTSKTVRLFLNSPSCFREKFVKDCIKDLESKVMLWKSGIEDVTPLERLAIYVLKDSAYIK